MAYLSRIAPELPVRDMQEAIRYYEQTLGFRLAAEFPGGDYAIVERDGVAIHLFADDSRGLPPAGIHIFTDELDGLQDEFLQRGAAISQPITPKPWGNRDFRVNDPSGNELKFTEPRPSDGEGE